jgi:threonine dehydratase
MGLEERRSTPRSTVLDVKGFASADVRHEVEAAEGRIRPHVVETPLEPSPRLSRDTGAEVLLKMENLQVTRSFKARGAFNALLGLDDAERAKGVVTASSGNHAMAMAHVMALLGIEGEIWLPDEASPAKIEALRRRGANLHLTGGDPELSAREQADRTGRVYVSPYNDPKVIGGQGTIALELLRQAERLDGVFVPVGGGGLISGIAGYLKEASPETQVIGCQPARSPVMAEAVRVGELREFPWESSLSDGTVGGVELGSITFPFCRDLVEDWVLPTEDEIAAAIELVMSEHWVMVEGAAVLSVASFLKTAERWRGKTVALVLSGSRISLDTLAEVLRRGHAAR